MAKQAMAAYTVLGFDAVRVPFAQIHEAEALGCKIKSGRNKALPGIDEPPPYKLDDIPILPKDFLRRGKFPELVKAVTILKRELGDAVAIVAGSIGPFTLAGYLLDTVPLLKATVRAPQKVRSLVG